MLCLCKLVEICCCFNFLLLYLALHTNTTVTIVSKISRHAAAGTRRAPYTRLQHHPVFALGRSRTVGWHP